MLTLDAIDSCWLFGNRDAVAVSGTLTFRNAAATPILDVEVCATGDNFPDWKRIGNLAAGATAARTLTAVKNNPLSPVQISVQARWRTVAGGAWQTASVTVGIKAAVGNQDFSYPVQAPLTRQNCKLVKQ